MCLSANSNVLDKGFRLKLISKKEKKIEVISLHSRESDFPADSHLTFVSFSEWIFCFAESRSFFQLIKWSQKFAAATWLNNTILLHVYFTPSTGWSQDVTSKSKKVKLISEMHSWMCAPCTHTHTETHTLRPIQDSLEGDFIRSGLQWCGGPSYDYLIRS